MGANGNSPPEPISDFSAQNLNARSNNRLVISNYPYLTGVLSPARVLKCHPSQTSSRFPGGYIQLELIENKKIYRFCIRTQTIDGKKAFLFHDYHVGPLLLQSKNVEAECLEKIRALPADECAAVAKILNNTMQDEPADDSRHLSRFFVERNLKRDLQVLGLPFLRRLRKLLDVDTSWTEWDDRGMTL